MGRQRKKYLSAPLERKGTYSIQEVYNAVKDHMFDKPGKVYVQLDGEEIKANSQRYQTFFTKGTKCVCCGIEGKYFAMERSPGDGHYHLNLYALDKDGQEVLMTKDHIVPRSRGGANDLFNYQPMCVICNTNKGSLLEMPKIDCVNY